MMRARSECSKTRSSWQATRRAGVGLARSCASSSGSGSPSTRPGSASILANLRVRPVRGGHAHGRALSRLSRRAARCRQPSRHRLVRRPRGACVPRGRAMTTDERLDALDLEIIGLQRTPGTGDARARSKPVGTTSRATELISFPHPSETRTARRLARESEARLRYGSTQPRSATGQPLLVREACGQVLGVR